MLAAYSEYLRGTEIIHGEKILIEQTNARHNVDRQTLNALQYLPCLIISPTRSTTSKTRKQACRVSIASSKFAAVFLDCNRARFFSTKPPPSWLTLASKEDIFSFIFSVYDFTVNKVDTEEIKSW